MGKVSSRLALYCLLLLFIQREVNAQSSYIYAGPDTDVCDGGVLTMTSAGVVPTGVITTLSSPVNAMSDDQFSGVVNIGFPFTFYGNVYTQCVVSTNNYISFDISQANNFSPWTISGASPSPANPNNSIMAPWQDLNPSGNAAMGPFIRVGVFGTAPNRYFVADWTNLPAFSCTGVCFTDQLILYEGSNIIETHITEKGLCGTWNSGNAIHGVQNAAGSVAHIVPGRNSGTTWTTSLEGMRWTPSGMTAYTISNIPFNPINLGITPTATFSWSIAGGGQISATQTVTVNPTAPTLYVAAVTQSACTNSYSFYDTVLVSIANPDLTVDGENASCLNPIDGVAWATTTTAAPPYTLTWNTSPPQTSDTISNLVPGTYIVTLLDAAGCSLEDTIVITDQGSLTTSVVGTIDILCHGQSTGNLQVAGNGADPPYTYTLNGNISSTGVFSNLPAGTYDVIVQDDSGCVALQPVTLYEPASALSMSLVNRADISCFAASDGLLEIAAAGGTAPYTFSNSIITNTSGLFQSLDPGPYQLSVLDANGCYQVWHDTITEPLPMLSNIVFSSNTSCFGALDGTALVVSSGGTQPHVYSWSSVPAQTTQQATGLAAGSYTVLVSDANNCSAQASVLITEPQEIIVNVSPDAEICHGDSILIGSFAAGGTGAIVVNWSHGTSLDTCIVAPVVTTQYIAIAVDGNGCLNSDTLTVVVNENPLPVFTTSLTSGCIPLCPTFVDVTTPPPGSSIVLKEWDFGDNSTAEGSNVEHCYNTPGKLDVTLTLVTDKGCKRATTLDELIEVYPKPEPAFTIEPPVTDSFDPEVQFVNLSSGNDLYEWDFGDGHFSNQFSNKHTYADTGYFKISLTATNSYGCSDSVSRYAWVKPYPSAFLPNAFTPNGDGNNDSFGVKATYFSNYEMNIYDRWGTLVFSQENASGVQWDGHEAPDGVYVYNIRLLDANGRVLKYTGSVTLFR